MATFSYEIGYRGKVALGSAPILATGGSVNLQQNPIMATGVWGAGVYNAAESVIYAPDFLRMEGDISFELTEGTAFTQLKEFGFTNRGVSTGKNISLLPNGTGGYTGKAWCSSMSFDANEGSIITGSFGYTSGEVETGWSPDPATGTGDETDIGTGSASSFTAVFPYWGTKVTLGSADQSGIISWNASYNSEVILLSLCDGATTAPVGPDYILIGQMSADGSFTVFGMPELLDLSTFQGSKACKITINSYNPATAATVAHSIDFSKILFSQGGSSIQTGNSYVQADFNFTALGDGSNPPMNIDQASA